MNNITFITRADDLGSSRSANRAIQRVVDAGFIRNVSVMACSPFVEEAAQLLAHRKDICFGMHTTLNAEWDRVKWEPVHPLEKNSGLVDDKGYFLADPSLFVQTKPSVERIMQEVDAQLERLHKLGFPICYIDSHMFPEMYVEGLDAAMEEFARKKGLLDHMYFYHLPPTGLDWSAILQNPDQESALPDGQYFMVSHPSLDTEEMRMTGNASVSGADVAASRAAETMFFSHPENCRALQDAGIRGIRYDEARFDKRRTVADLTRILSGN